MIISFAYDLDFPAHFKDNCYYFFKDSKDSEILGLFGKIRDSESPRFLVRMARAARLKISEIFGRAVFVSGVVFYMIYFFLVVIVAEIIFSAAIGNEVNLDFQLYDAIINNYFISA